MKVGIVGLGKMGEAIAHRALRGGHEVLGFDPNEQARQNAEYAGATTVSDLTQLTQQARLVWIMVPAGKPVDDVLGTIIPTLQKEDIIIDGGNSHFNDSIRRYNDLLAKDIHFLDCGVSGGLNGKEIGFSLMVGGKREIYEKVELLFRSISAPDGYSYMGPAGAGHYVKMIHNGIEYALLQAYAEGFHLLRQGRYPDLDLAKISDVWFNGSVIRSWIVELARDIFAKDQSLENISGHIGENLTGRWTFEEAQEQNVPVKLIKDALDIREWSRQTGGNFATKVVALFRNAFGGHPIKKIKNGE
jgi:6-phosphogluconate dehydrogenase